VFVLGAGVSVSSGIVAAKDILRESVVRLAQINKQKAKRVISLLTHLYPNFQPVLMNYPNIEDFLNLLEMARRFNSEEFIESTTWAKQKLDEVKAITLKAVTDYIWERMQQISGSNAVSQFVRDHLKPGDTVVTFNWDITIERALWNEGLAFWYHNSLETDKDSVTILKPHGSIDWFQQKHLSGVSKNGNVMKLDTKVAVYTKFNFSENPGLLRFQPVIVPPVAAKEFPFYVLKRTWRSVYRKISRATSLNILGYSLPKEDLFARLVLGRALRTNRIRAERGQKRPLRVLVVNPDESTEITFRRLVGPGVKRFSFHQATFENFISGLKETDDL